jgi:hypothetical protein
MKKAKKRAKKRKQEKLTPNGAMYRDGVCSCCGEDGIARLTIVDRSDGTFCGKMMLQLCTECEQMVVKASDYIKVGTDVHPLRCAGCSSIIQKHEAPKGAYE